ncbi:MAG: hypothetical protein JWN62_2993 [Acidimicrobiales bacterium]|nr:hypothetical protein [Acidimicrobiales bacterium]
MRPDDVVVSQTTANPPTPTHPQPLPVAGAVLADSTPAPLAVRDVMTAPAVVLAADASYAEVVHRFLSSDIGGMPVVDDTGRLVGLVTEADLMFKEAYPHGSISVGLAWRPDRWQEKSEARSASDLMTRDPAAADLDESLDVVARRMVEHDVSRLPVVHEGRVVGVVSRHDVLRRFDRPDYVIAAEIDRAISATELGSSSTRTSVLDGDVVLSGFVSSAEDLDTLERIASSVDGTVSIDNQLVVRPSHVTAAESTCGTSFEVLSGSADVAADRTTA